MKTHLFNVKLNEEEWKDLKLCKAFLGTNTNKEFIKLAVARLLPEKVKEANEYGVQIGVCPHCGGKTHKFQEEENCSDCGRRIERSC